MRYFLLLLPLILAACASGPSRLPAPAIAPDELLARRTIGLDPRPYRDEKYWLNTDMVMRHFVESSTDYLEADQVPFTLLESLREEWPVRKYQRDANYSAAVAFHENQANCLSYSAMVVSLMRHAGVKAHFQRVEAAPEWDLEGNSVVAALHVNAVIYRRGKPVEVDWLPRRNPTPEERKIILTDDEALAEWHNNLGAEALLDNDLPLAFAELSRALRLSPEAAHIWVNLGVVYRRVNLLQHAESSWLIALAHNKRQLQAMSNLQMLYRSQNQLGRVDELETLMQYYRRQNPFYYYLLAQKAERAERYDEARRHILRAKRLHSDLRFDALHARILQHDG